MKKALVVGINYYSSSPLYGCVDDAYAMKSVLDTNGDGSPNFDVRMLTGTGPTDQVTRGQLKDQIVHLFEGDSDIAFLYYSGHGHLETTGGYLFTSECVRGDDGLAIQEVMTLAKASRAKNKIIALDCCYSGIAGNPPSQETDAVLAEGFTIVTASTKDQYAMENNEGGVFTNLFVDAMKGAAANLVGEITPGSVYAHIDKSLGWWEQRPVFKTNVKSFVSLRTVQPPIALAALKKLVEFFPSPGSEFSLDPSFEPELRGRAEHAAPPDPLNVERFAVLQQYNRLNLLVPVGAPHMWHAAMESKACRLTALGEHYRRLVSKKRI